MQAADKWWRGLTPEERAATETYVAGLQDRRADPAVLARAVAKGRLPRATTVYRTLNFDAAERWSQRRPGATTTFDAPVSTSLDRQTSLENFGLNVASEGDPIVVLEISAPAGHPAGYVEAANAEYSNQELLLGGGNWRVASRRETSDEGHPVISLRLEPVTATPPAGPPTPAARPSLQDELMATTDALSRQVIDADYPALPEGQRRSMARIRYQDSSSEDAVTPTFTVGEDGFVEAVTPGGRYVVAPGGLTNRVAADGTQRRFIDGPANARVDAADLPDWSAEYRAARQHALEVVRRLQDSPVGGNRSAAQREAVDGYAINGRYAMIVDPEGQPSAAINRALRAGRKPGRATYPLLANRDAEYGSRTRTQSVDLAAMDRDLRASMRPLPEPVRTYRGVGANAAPSLARLNVGDTFTDPGFMSTSPIAGNGNEYSADGALMEIRLPAGHPALMPNTGNPVDFGELVLPPGTRLQLTAKQPPAGDRSEPLYVFDVAPDTPARDVALPRAVTAASPRDAAAPSPATPPAPALADPGRLDVRTADGALRVSQIPAGDLPTVLALLEQARPPGVPRDTDARNAVLARLREDTTTDPAPPSTAVASTDTPYDHRLATYGVAPTPGMRATLRDGRQVTINEDPLTARRDGQPGIRITLPDGKRAVADPKALTRTPSMPYPDGMSRDMRTGWQAADATLAVNPAGRLQLELMLRQQSFGGVGGGQLFGRANSLAGRGFNQRVREEIARLDAERGPLRGTGGPSPAPDPTPPRAPARRPRAPRVKQPDPISQPGPAAVRTTHPKLGPTASRVVDAISRVHAMPASLRTMRLLEENEVEGVFRHSPLQAVSIGVNPRLPETARAGAAAHEIGHLLDWHTGERRGSGRMLRRRMGLSTDQRFLSAAYGSETMRKVGQNGDRFAAYLNEANEVWARAYSQYVAMRSADARMRQWLQTEQRRAARAGLPEVWGDAEFEPIAEAIDAILAEKGLRPVGPPDERS